MKPSLVLWAFGVLAPSTTSLLLDPAKLDSQMLASYDYIVVGGGTSGLVVANRLTEDRNVSVLVLEAGELDASDSIVTVPGLIGRDLGTRYDWNFSTTPQTYLDGRARPYSAGRVVGGGSVLNGMIWTRGASADYDAWEALGNPGWGWEGMLPYFKKSENFTPDTTDAHPGRAAWVDHDTGTHGFQGPVRVSYPSFIYNQSTNFLRGLSELGVALLRDPNTGAATGATIPPSSMDPRNQSRSDSRTAYLDPVLDHRLNLHLATGQTATRILLQRTGNDSTTYGSGRLIRATGIEFASEPDGVRHNVTCSREVILAAGAIMTPVLLQVSGMGPAPVLSSINVSVQVDLPGVGYNLQDHGMVGALYNYTNPDIFTADNITGPVLQSTEALYYGNRTGPWTAPLVSAVAFPSLRTLTPSSWSALLEAATADGIDDDDGASNGNLPTDAGRHPALLRGYAIQRRAVLRQLYSTSGIASELMADSTGMLTVAAQRPLSRGSVRALHADLLPAPGPSSTQGKISRGPPPVAIDPRYCADPLDAAVLVAALRFNGRVVGTRPMRALGPEPAWPWVVAGQADTEEESRVEEARLLGAVRGRLQTEFHPCGTASMLPAELGGVVDPRLRVHGVASLRVVDAAAIPLIPAAHLQAAVYAVAEKAADMIKLDRDEAKGPSRRPWRGG